MLIRGANMQCFRGSVQWSGALERGDGASLKSLAQRIDAYGGVGAFATIVEAAELIVRQAAQEKARER